ncbi:Hypp6822 [Branchiostoma lanceolatum]|uniref:Hypp6822 protein n=1 Tax=Branchiostoma lanceolatum TaxID=7740 RepID=A0A8J9YVL6_BRALA|nr:Hypp6822 [Branchiostoma lanceolatum]
MRALKKYSSSSLPGGSASEDWEGYLNKSISQDAGIRCHLWQHFILDDLKGKQLQLNSRNPTHYLTSKTGNNSGLKRRLSLASCKDALSKATLLRHLSGDALSTYTSADPTIKTGSCNDVMDFLRAIFQRPNDPSHYEAELNSLRQSATESGQAFEVEIVMEGRRKPQVVTWPKGEVFAVESPPDQQPPPPPRRINKELTPEETKWIQRWLRVKDKFNISDSAFHEIRMLGQERVPPLYRVIEERKEQSKMIPIITEDTNSLDRRSLRDLLTHLLRHHHHFIRDNMVSVRLSGDGRQVTRNHRIVIRRKLFSLCKMGITTAHKHATKKQKEMYEDHDKPADQLYTQLLETIWASWADDAPALMKVPVEAPAAEFQSKRLL